MRRLAAAVGLAALVLSGGAHAQVIEIGDGGAVTTYDRPTVFTAEGAAPIETRRARIRVAGGLVRAPTEATGVALRDAADGAALSRDLIEAVAWQESRMRGGVVSAAGAIGEMQLMPATARALGVDPWDTRDNFRGGANYLGGLVHRYDGDLIRALAAYNAGPGAVDRYGGVPPYRETQAYVAAIMNRLGRRAVQGASSWQR
jgi:soluble lytic murein transglycosylase-like protein